MIAIREWIAGAPTGRIIQIRPGILHANAAAVHRQLERRRDPARISGIKFRLVREVNRRFNELKAAIQVSIVTNDCFGIASAMPPTTNAPVPPAPPPGLPLRKIVPIAPKKFAFARSQEKIDGFMDWLRKQQDLGILDIVERPGMGASVITPQWSGVYVDSYYVKALRETYEKGLRSAMATLKKAGYPVQTGPVPQTGPLFQMMQQPFHADRVGLIYSRTYEDLKTVMQVMDAQVRTKIADGLTTGLARGMAEGKNGAQIARELMKDVNSRLDVVGANRVRMICRTEVAKAHVSATIGEYRRAGVEGVEVVLEWETAGDPCPVCEELQAGGPYTLDEFDDLYPPHPNCECSPKPEVVGVTAGGEAASQAAEDAVAAAA